MMLDLTYIHKQYNHWHEGHFCYETSQVAHQILQAWGHVCDPNIQIVFDICHEW